MRTFDFRNFKLTLAVFEHLLKNFDLFNVRVKIFIKFKIYNSKYRL